MIAHTDSPEGKHRLAIVVDPDAKVDTETRAECIGEPNIAGAMNRPAHWPEAPCISEETCPAHWPSLYPQSAKHRPVGNRYAIVDFPEP